MADWADSAAWTDEHVAIIGMAGRFPGAADLDRFWANLASGTESTEPLAAQDEFDAAFFGVLDGEALLLDPQHRVFLECCWAALEDAGYDPAGYPGAIGVYAGGSENDYPAALRTHRDRLAFADDWQIKMATGLDFLTTRVAYKLGLSGPAVTVQTACSTSLVAIHLAGQALIAGDCDLALAGGVTVHPWPDEPAEQDGGLLSTDGHIRAFDAKADGTVFANGAGALVLKRLGDARRDRDGIRAVILGSAVNNDGAGKIGFTAPSVVGQAAAIRDAHLAAGIDPGTIGYVEAHGTGTPLGDPIEITALTRAFRRGTQTCGYCPIGSVKTNIGHVDAAAGVVGVIKTVLAMRHGLIPPSLNFETPNPEIDFAESPFYVPTRLLTWPRDGRPRRAGVSALGIGGTNAHLVLEEYPEEPAPAAARPWQLLVVSARTEPAAAASASRLGAHLGAHPELNLADVAWTLQAGRRAHPHRRFAVCAGPAEAAEALAQSHAGVAGRPLVAFAFPGQGGQHPGMTGELYRHEPVFRARVDDCAELATGALGFDLRALLYPNLHPGGQDRTLYEMSVGQPAVFAVEYALAGLLLHWGITPDVLVGHSLGAYAAACVAGVLSLADAVGLVVERGRLLQSIPAGAMLAVPLPESEVAGLLTGELDIAVVNSPAQCVVAGPPPAIEALRARLAERGVDARRLRIPIPAHSRYVEPVAAAFADRLARLTLRPPTIPVLSEITGCRLTDEEITSPAYWSWHLRHTVRFGDALSALFADPHRVVVEVGPGQALTAILRRHPGRTPGVTAVSALPHPEEDASDLATVLTAVGQLWSAGAAVDWAALHREPQRRVSLPTYPFERRRYLIDPPVWVNAAAPEPVRIQLPVPDPEPVATEQADDVQATLAGLFGQVLGLPEVRPGDSFFALGGDSVIAAQVVRSIRHTFAVSLSLRAIFRNPTVAGLARCVKDQLDGPPAPAAERGPVQP